MARFGRKRDGETAGAAPARPERRPDERGEREPGFLPRRGGRRGIESLFMRLVATGGIIGIGTALAAILGTQDIAHWITGLVVSTLTVVLAAVLWSSRVL